MGIIKDMAGDELLHAALVSENINLRNALLAADIIQVANVRDLADLRESRLISDRAAIMAGQEIAKIREALASSLDENTVRRTKPRASTLLGGLSRAKLFLIALSHQANFFPVAAAGILVFIVGFLSWFHFTAARDAVYLIRHTYEVISTADHLAIAIRDAETHVRGYILTGDEQFSVPFKDAAGQVILLQGELRQLTADNPGQRDRLQTLALAVERKLDILTRGEQVRRNDGFDEALNMTRTGAGTRAMKQISATLNAVQAEESRLLAQRQDASARTENVLLLFTIGGALFAVSLLAVSARLLTGVRARVIASGLVSVSLAEQMRTTFNSLSQGIGVFGADYRLVRWNTCFPTLLSLPEPMMRPGTPYDAILEHITAAAGSDGLVLETEEQIRRRGRILEPVVYERTRALDDRSFEIRRTAMPGDDGFLLTITETTERVRGEVTNRTSQRLQAMGQLTGGIAHDFNNLLQVVLGNLELALPKLEKGSPILMYIDQAMWGARRGASLTQQLLTFARRQPLSPKPLDVSVILAEMAKLLDRTLGAEIELQVVDMPGVWSAMADGTQMESAVLNLALNARDAMPGGGQLTIEVANKVLNTDYTRQHTEIVPGEYVMLAVSDTGTGMSPEVKARIFEPFFTTKTLGKGTGLGLAMVYGFAKQSDGHVRVYSKPGEGTTIRLYLPRAIELTEVLELPADTPRAANNSKIIDLASRDRAKRA